MSERIVFILGLFCMIVGLSLSIESSYVIRDTNQHARDAISLKNKAIAVLDSLRAVQCIPRRSGWHVVQYKIRDPQKTP